MAIQLDSVPASCLSSGHLLLVYLTGLDKFEFRKVCEVEGQCKHFAAEAMHRLGLCITDPEDSKMLHLSQHLHSPMCGAVTVRSEAQEGAGLPLLGVIFVIFQLCNLQAALMLFSHSPIPTCCCREIGSYPMLGDTTLLPHPAVADMMVCALPQPLLNFLSVAAPPRVTPW